MNFHHLAYWQDKALSLAIENPYLLTVNILLRRKMKPLKPLIRSPRHRWRKLPAARASISTVR